MVVFPLSVLALAAGVYLLVKVKREFLGGVFEWLSWLVIVLALVSVGFQGYKTFTHGRFGGGCHDGKEYRIEKRIIKGGDGETCPHGMGMMEGHHGKAGCGMNGCAMDMKGCSMEGDSCVMTKEACVAKFGEAACNDMISKHGRCIMSKEECLSKCSPHGAAACASSEKKCCKKAVE